MIFYDKEGKKYNFDIVKEDYIDRGRTAKIYKIDDNECLKVINRDPFNYFDEELFDDIKSLSLDSLAKLGTPFYNNGKIKAYTMEYLKRSSKSILDMPTDYTLDNLNSLYKDLLILARELIIARDLYHRNVIVGDSKMTIIDFDSYEKSTFNNDIIYSNTWSLLYTFRRLYQEELISKGINCDEKIFNNMTINDYLLYLFNPDVREEPAKVLERSLAGTRTPMDLFNKKGKNIVDKG